MNESEAKKFIFYQLKDIIEILSSENITEIMLNQDNYIWIDTFNGTKKTDIKIDDERAKAILTSIASYNNKEIDKKNKIISGILPTGERFEGILGEEANYKTIFSIRKKSSKIITLDEYINQSFMSHTQKQYLEKQVLNKKNILIVGGTSSGKTTFANALLNILKNTTDRVIILEDTDELECPAPNQLKLKSTLNTEMIKLLQSCMRLNPDRIVVGELRRGAETLELLKAWNSGHSGGISTIHANDSISGLFKIEQYLMEIIPNDMTMLIANSINIVVNIIKENGKRRLKEIIEILGYDKTKKEYMTKLIEEGEKYGNDGT